jgi:ubiquinone/menaquinone biosynthesis C-methylase UbiE
MLKRIVARIPGHKAMLPLMNQRKSTRTTAWEMVEDVCAEMGHQLKVLDLGCGPGDSAQLFLTLDKTLNWYGVDIADSPEVNTRKDHNSNIYVFDGINLPFSDEEFDIIYCHQVLEHVERPYELTAEVYRVLKRGGMFVGSVSYLEPYHSFSVFNFTPYGFRIVMENERFTIQEINYTTSVFYNIFRQILGGRSILSVFSKYSVLFFVIDIIRFLTRGDICNANLLKLQYSGTFCFRCKKF